MRRVAVAMAVLVIGVVSCGGSQSLTSDDDGDHVSLTPGAEIQVTLEGNATTGFSWELIEYDPVVIAPVNEPVYEKDDDELVGAGGRWIWTLRAVASGESPVQFVYHRAWEDEPPESVFSFTATVGE